MVWLDPHDRGTIAASESLSSGEVRNGRPLELRFNPVKPGLQLPLQRSFPASAQRLNGIRTALDRSEGQYQGEYSRRALPTYNPFMTRHALLSAVVLISFVVGACQEQKSSSSPRTYTSTILGFSYTYPAQLIPNTEELRRNLNSTQKGEVQEGVLFSAFEKPSPPRAREAVVINAENSSIDNANLDVKHCLQKVTIYQSSQGWTVLHQGMPAIFDGQHFLRGDYKKANPLVFQTVICAIWEGSALEFIFSAGTQDEIDQLVRSLDTIRFKKPGSKTISH
jgi:hypothetical protein